MTPSHWHLFVLHVVGTPYPHPPVPLVHCPFLCLAPMELTETLIRRGNIVFLGWDWVLLQQPLEKQLRKAC